MPLAEKKTALQISRQNNSYYNGMAAEYDRLLEREASNKIIREIVAGQFGKLVQGGRVLDFGGGTGLDIGWMNRQGYLINFCEPSFAMRRIAMQRVRNEFPSARVSFMDESQTDFRNWEANFPFENKMNAALANFAVLNCIADIGLVFEKIALALETGGLFLALVMDSSLKNRLRSGIKKTIHSFLPGKSLQITVTHHGRQQRVYMHSTMQIRKALHPYFELIKSQPLEHFNLLQFRKK